MQLRSVILPVDDMEAALRFWTEVVGLSVKLRDADRYAALDAGGVTIALAALGERPPDQALSFKVDDVATALERLVAAGATVVQPANEGPHETRAAVRDPSGNLLFVYASR